MDLGGVLRTADEQLTVDRLGGSYPEAFPGSAIHLVGHGIELFLAVARQGCALGEVLAD